jgi:hypothetical protein
MNYCRSFVIVARLSQTSRRSERSRADSRLRQPSDNRFSVETTKRQPSDNDNASYTTALAIWSEVVCRGCGVTAPEGNVVSTTKMEFVAGSAQASVPVAPL